MTRPDDLEAVALAELADRVAKRKAAARVVAGADLGDGDKRTIRSPLDGAALGLILRTDPDPQWRVTDVALLAAYIRAQRPDAVETRYELHVPGVDDPVLLDPIDELCQVLRAYAPHMLRQTERLRDSAIQDLLEASKRSGKAAAPGIELVKPAGSVQVRRAKTCGPAIERLVQAGQLSWDVRPQLPTGEQVAS